MVLVLQFYDVYWESILGLASKRVALVSPNLASKWFSALPGFAPAGEALLFRQKDPKPLTPSPVLPDWAVAGYRGASQLAALRQGSPGF